MLPLVLKLPVLMRETNLHLVVNQSGMAAAKARPYQGAWQCQQHSGWDILDSGALTS
jgi:hypothetical protein